MSARQPFSCNGLMIGDDQGVPKPFCNAKGRIAALEGIITNLINDAMPSNWHENDMPTQSWSAAMEAMGINPESMKEGTDG